MGPAQIDVVRAVRHRDPMIATARRAWGQEPTTMPRVAQAVAPDQISDLFLSSSVTKRVAAVKPRQLPVVQHVRTVEVSRAILSCLHKGEGVITDSTAGGELMQVLGAALPPPRVSAWTVAGDPARALHKRRDAAPTRSISKRNIRNRVQFYYFFLFQLIARNIKRFRMFPPNIKN